MARRVSAGRTRGEETPPRPLPPPPRPHNRRDLPRPSAYFKRSSSSSRQQHSVRNSAQEDDDNGEEEEEPAPQPAPVPHAHPLATLTGARPGAKDARALSGKRLNPAFLNPARVAAFTDQENIPTRDGTGLALVQRQQQQQQEPTSALANEMKHSTRVIERQWRLQLEQPGNRRAGDRAPLLTDEELVLAATDAATLRQALRYRDVTRALEITAGDEEEAAYPELARAMERKVKKQLDPAWVRARSDPDNRPRRALERPEELDLYESLLRATLSDVQCTGQHQDAGEDSLEAGIQSRSRFQRLPLAHRGFIGLPGSCFDPLHG